MGTTIDVTGGVQAYIATPDQGAGLGLLVLQEHWGIVPHIEHVCDRFAAEGFTAVAPDLVRATTPPRAEGGGDTQMTGLHLGDAARALGAVVDDLDASPSVRGDGVGVVGFGMGGDLALVLAAERPSEVRACVAFYGPVPREVTGPDWSRLQAPVQAHVAEDDSLVSPEDLAELEATLSGLGKDIELFVYPDAGHAFFDDTRPEAYNAAAASLAWIRTLEFLRAKLG